MKKSPMERMLPYLIVAVAPLCWAGNIVLGRGVIHLIPPVSLAFWRWSVALAILLPFTFRQARADWPTLKQGWRVMVAISFFGITCFNTLLYIAVHTTTAINGSLIQSTMPAFIIVVSLAVLRERVTRVQILGVLLCMAGAFTVVLRGDLRALGEVTFVLGDLLMLIAVVLYALYSVLLRIRPPIHPASVLTYTFGIGVLFLLPLYLWERVKTGPLPLTPGVVSTILYVAVFPSIVAYLCWNRGIAVIGPNKTGLFINLLPIFASILAVVLLGEDFRWFHLAGMGMIFSGMLLFNR